MDDGSAALSLAKSCLSELDAEAATPEHFAAAGSLRERYTMARIDAALRSSRFDRAARWADELARDFEGREAASSELATVLLLQGIAEMGMFRVGQAAPNVPAGTLVRTLQLPGLYPGTHRQAWLKLLDLGLATGDWQGAETCLRRLERDFGADRDARAAEMVAIRAYVLRELRRGEQAEAVRAEISRLAQAWLELGGPGGLPARGGVGFLAAGWRRVVLSEWIRSQVGDGEPCVEVDRVRSSLEGLLEFESATTLARVRTSQQVSIDKVLGALAVRDHTVLVYLPARFGSHLFCLSADEISHWPLPTEIRLTADASQLARMLRTSPDRLDGICDELLQLGETVRQALLPEPVLQRVLSGGSVTVVGAGYLGNLPFEALPVAGGADLLGEVAAVDYLDSLTLGVGLWRSAERSELSRDVALLGCTRTPLEQAGIESVAFSKSWVEPILAVEDGAALVLDDGVTVAAVEGAINAPKYGMVHVVAHGVRRWDSEFSNGIALFDQALWPDSLHGVTARGLVVLSACGAAQGESRLGDSSLLTNLGGALLWQGAQAVVLPQAPIPVGPHLRMMGVFHRSLRQEGASPAEALRVARAAVREVAGWPQRFNNASVQVHGLGQRPLWFE